MVVNGVELGGGSIRIHQPDVQKTVFEEVLQIPPEETKLRFGYMLEAFRYGAPPHGGIALGFDRLCAILCGTPSIRDVIAFPKTAKGTDLMTDSPAAVTPRQLRDLHIEVKAAVKKSEKPQPCRWLGAQDRVKECQFPCRGLVLRNSGVLRQSGCTIV